MPRPITPDLSKEINDLSDFWRVFPLWAGQEALNFYQNSFTRQGWLDSGFKPWAPRKAAEKRQKRYGTRSLLVKRGRLRRSLRLRTAGPVITIFTDVPYAATHNEGLKVEGTQQVPATAIRAHVLIIKGKRSCVSAHTRAAHTRRVSCRLASRDYTIPPNELCDHIKNEPESLI